MCKIPNLSKGCYCYPIEPETETPVHQQKKSNFKIPARGRRPQMVVEVSGSWASQVAGIGGRIRWLHYAGQLQDQTEAVCVNGQGRWYRRLSRLGLETASWATCQTIPS
ncbi:hypothetical protein KL918_003688 [Ogataea parapolymorpha]|nr:hypothetical protein KL918_003688 [Ogataea parapolymorpha]KAG7871356.1 hypothetical protein KL916_004151 [Ogataea parapolymorpha]